jgi:hypothetical protein
MSQKQNWLLDVMRHVPTQAERGALLDGYSQTALAAREGRDKPKNPHPNPENGSSEQAMLYSAWRQGAQRAEADWQRWAVLPAYEKELFEKACEDAARNKAEPASRGDVPKEEPKPYKPETVTAAIHGYRQQNEEAQGLVNEAKLLEAQVLAYLQKLHDRISNEMGELAKAVAEHQSSGYQRMSVAEQQARLEEFKAKERELNTAARWLALAKTSIEVGFMEANRSTFRPAPVKPAGDV